MHSNDNGIIAEQLEKKYVAGFKILDVRDKYRLHLTRDFRKLVPVEEGSRIIVAKDSNSQCPYCKKEFKLPGFRLYVLPKGEQGITVIIESSDEQPVQGTHIILS